MGKCLFNDRWLEDDKYKGWLKKTANLKEARCDLCKKNIQLGTMGQTALDSHAKCEKHKRYIADQSGSLPIQMFTTPSPSAQPSRPTSATSRPIASTSAFSTFSNTATLKAEVLWVLRTVSRHQSYTLNDDIHTVFQAMFPDSECVSAFSCGRDKTAYLARFGIAPYVKKELVARINQGNFVIMFDESMNRATNSKQLDLHVRHWVTDQTGTHHVQSRYLGSQFMGHSTAEDLLEHFKECTKDLNLRNMISLSMDGPSVNWKFVNLLQQEHGVQFGGVQLIIVGSCGLHTLHNAFKSGFEVWQIQKVLKSLHYLFHNAPARREDFTSSTSSTTFPLPFCGHRWLENLPTVQRAIEIWPAIEKFVDQVKSKVVKNPGTSSYDTLSEARLDPLLQAKLHFFMAISRAFQPFLEKYQTDAPMMPFLCKDLEDLIR
ncbi:uncharacterized protein [Chanodichthys erythropterus]|uniref:uncharacterized protein n=1 Tax=Chanodichthys erythropterus TaxID=933992 RepID=UPI00351F4905